MKATALACATFGVLLATPAAPTPVRLRCEHLDNPLGIDALRPRLSWQSNNSERNWRQSVPANTTAKVYLPQIANSKITEGGRAVDAQLESGGHVVRIGSGTYDFQVR